MKDTKKAKWLIGTSAVLLSGFILTQMNDADINDSNMVSQNDVASVETSKMSKKEKELFQLDWTNYTIAETTSDHFDRQTKRS